MNQPKYFLGMLDDVILKAAYIIFVCIVMSICVIIIFSGNFF
jgi:hypothetical protein